MPKNKNKKTRSVCLCNRVSLETIAKAVKEGASTLDEIYDQTTAGVGPCGGSCRPLLSEVLEEYESTGEFPTIEELRPKR